MNLLLSRFGRPTFVKRYNAIGHLSLGLISPHVRDIGAHGGTILVWRGRMLLVYPVGALVEVFIRGERHVEAAVRS
jgi:hypothetical protein